MIQICMKIPHEALNITECIQKYNLFFYTNQFSNILQIQYGGVFLRKTNDVLCIFAWETTKCIENNATLRLKQDVSAHNIIVILSKTGYSPPHGFQESPYNLVPSPIKLNVWLHCMYLCLAVLILPNLQLSCQIHSSWHLVLAVKRENHILPSKSLPTQWPIERMRQNRRGLFSSITYWLILTVCCLCLIF